MHSLSILMEFSESEDRSMVTSCGLTSDTFGFGGKLFNLSSGPSGSSKGSLRSRDLDGILREEDLLGLAPS